MNEIISKFKALSDRNRVRILGALTTCDELCACQITELLQISGATTSRHLGILISTNLIESRKEGRWVFYCLKPDCDGFETVMEWIKEKFPGSLEMEQDIISLGRITAFNREDLCRQQRGEKCCPKGRKR